MSASNSLYVLFKISIKTFDTTVYSTNLCFISFCIIQRKVKYYSFLWQQATHFLDAYINFTFLNKCCHNSWIWTFWYNWNTIMLVFEENVKSDHFPKLLHHCLHILAAALLNSVQWALQHELCIIFKRWSLRIAWVCMYVELSLKHFWYSIGKLLSHIMATYADSTLF